MSVAIKIENISKQYRLGQVGTGTISHDLNRWWANIRGKEDPYSKVGQINQRDQAAESDYVWALKDIDFEVEQGEVLGIIGANGAGKSTLLKIISRITSPTTGSIKAKGRIASLLEVGTGMHPEMTARENIYLNGAIMGMKRREITKKFDDIIDFAGCKMYVDTPVKRFSSGMKVRLGFAVAAFLEPEILIVDEVLAVGDAEFQRRAIGKMKEVSCADGRTILFVSHNMAAVSKLCNTACLITEGKIGSTKDCQDVIKDYLKEGYQDDPISLVERLDRKGTGLVRLNTIEFVDSTEKRVYRVASGDSLNVQIGLQSEDTVVVSCAVGIDNSQGLRITQFFSELTTPSGITLNAGVNEVLLLIPELPLVPGEYTLSFSCISNGDICDQITNVTSLSVVDGDFFKSGRNRNSRWSGLCYIRHEFADSKKLN